MQATEALCHLSVTDIKKTFCNVWFFCKNEACANCKDWKATTVVWLMAVVTVTYYIGKYIKSHPSLPLFDCEKLYCFFFLKESTRHLLISSFTYLRYSWELHVNLTFFVLDLVKIYNLIKANIDDCLILEVPWSFQSKKAKKDS